MILLRKNIKDNNILGGAKQMLKELRLQAGLTQKELSEKVHVNQSTVSMWENGKSIPEMINIKALAIILKVSAYDLAKYYYGI